MLREQLKWPVQRRKEYVVDLFYTTEQAQSAARDLEAAGAPQSLLLSSAACASTAA